MRVLNIGILVTAAALTTAILSLPVAADPVGCKPGNAQSGTVKSTDCMKKGQVNRSSRAGGSMAYSPRRHGSKSIRGSTSQKPAPKGTTDNPGVAGGSRN